MEIKIPLTNRIRREFHRQIASAQDIVLEEVYRFIQRPVLHGGTCIWRCYSGKRFSEDLDFYFPKEKRKIELLFESLKNKGFDVRKKKISERSVYSELVYGRVSVRLEATFRKVKGILADYEKIDGTIITIYGLTPESLILEKISAYLKRKKIRDLYDIFFLLNQVRDFKSIKNPLSDFVKKYSPPEDEQDLQAIILEGNIFSSEDLISYIKRKL